MDDCGACMFEKVKDSAGIIVRGEVDVYNSSLRLHDRSIIVNIFRVLNGWYDRAVWCFPHYSGRIQKEK